MDTVRDKRRQDELVKVAEQAAEWLIALDEGGSAERAGFAEWIEESPLHVEMFLRAAALDRMGELLDPADRKEMAESVLSGTSHSNVIPLQAAPSHTAQVSAAEGSLLLPSEMRTARRVRWVAGAVASAALLLVTCGAVLWLRGAGWDTYTTSVGEQRVVQLADGSVVYVNTDTRIGVRYSERTREVQLKSGEALFKVARDSRRPFRVQVGDATVQAVGTQFNIYRRPTQTTVAVIEGVVQVSKDGDASLSIPPPESANESRQGGSMKSALRAARLASGQAVQVTADGPIERPVAVNIAQVTAWRQRRLVFEWETLEAIAAEFNRYNRTPQIRVDGEGVRARRYTAVFDADNPQTLLKFLAKDADLAFAAEGDDFVIRAR